MRCSGRTVLSRDSRPGVAVFDLVLVLDQDQVRVRTLTRRPAGRPGPHAALNLAANSSSSAQFISAHLMVSRHLSIVIVNVESCSDCGKRILLCIPFLISNHLPYAVWIQSFFICQLFYSVLSILNSKCQSLYSKLNLCHSKLCHSKLCHSLYSKLNSVNLSILN